MLSYNTDKYNKLILKRIKENLFSKKTLSADTGTACQLTTPSQISVISGILGQKIKDIGVATKNFLLNRRVSVGQHGDDINGQGATSELIENYQKIENGKLLDKAIPAHKKALNGLSNFHKRFAGTLGEGTKRFGTIVGGIDIGWAKKSMYMFGTKQTNSAFNAISSVFSTDRWNGTRMVMKDIAMAIHTYHKRAREVGEKVHQGWEKIIGNGFKGLKAKDFKELDAILSDPTHEHYGVIKLNDLYDENGKLRWQVPKSVIESISLFSLFMVVVELSIFDL